jgi:AraC family transcriptional regulator
MLHHAFPDLQWLKKQTESRFAPGKVWNGEPMPVTGWPNVILNVKAGAIYRDNILGPLSLFSNVSGQSSVTIDGRTSIVSEDHFFLTNNAQRYTLEIQERKSAETLNIHFGERWLENAFAGLTHAYHHLLDNELDHSIEFYNKLYRKDDITRVYQQQLIVTSKSRLEREEILLNLISHLIRINRSERLKADNLVATKKSTRDEIMKRLHLATDYIYTFYYKDVTLDELSAASMVSRFHFLRAFKQAFQITPHQFLLNVRMEKARELLQSTQMEVADVGKAVGVKDSSSFSRMFKKELKVYPTQFRRILNSEFRIPSDSNAQSLY